MQFSKNCYISETTWNFPKQFEMQRVKTSNMICPNIGHEGRTDIYIYGG